MGLPEDSGFPAFEDQAHFLLAAQKVPLGVDVADNKIKDAAERSRRIFARLPS